MTDFTKEEFKEYLDRIGYLIRAEFGGNAYVKDYCSLVCSNEYRHWTVTVTPSSDGWDTRVAYNFQSPDPISAEINALNHVHTVCQVLQKLRRLLPCLKSDSKQ